MRARAAPLTRVSRIGSVEVTDLFTVETYRSVHQMTSGITAEPYVIQAVVRDSGEVLPAPRRGPARTLIDPAALALIERRRFMRRSERMSAEPSAGGVRLHVRDQGPGFDADLDGRAFERFTRGDTSADIGAEPSPNGLRRRHDCACCPASGGSTSTAISPACRPRPGRSTVPSIPSARCWTPTQTSAPDSVTSAG